MQKHPQHPQLKSRKARELLEKPEQSFAKRHPLISTAILSGAVLISSVFVSKYAENTGEKIDADSARASVPARESRVRERLNQVKNILKARKALAGRITWGGEDEPMAGGLGGELKLKLFSMNDDALMEYKDGLEDELEDAKERLEELGNRWPNITDAEGREVNALQERAKEIYELQGVVSKEEMGRGTETILANGIEWRGEGELLNWHADYLRVQQKGWNGQELNGDNADYVDRMLLVLNWAIDARKQGFEPLPADLALFRPDYLE